MADMGTIPSLTPLQLPLWAEWIKALSLPIAAIIGIGIGIFNAYTAHHSRKQSLFDRRLQFLREYRSTYERIDAPETKKAVKDSVKSLGADKITHEVVMGEQIKALQSIVAALDALAVEARFLFDTTAERQVLKSAQMVQLSIQEIARDTRSKNKERGEDELDVTQVTEQVFDYFEAFALLRTAPIDYRPFEKHMRLR